MLKKLFYYNDGKITEIEKVFIPNIKTGNDNTYEVNNDKNIVTKKFIKQGIYHPEILNQPDKTNKLYFDRKEFCILLHNNKDLLELSKPGLFIDNITDYIKKTDTILKKLSKYFLDSCEREKYINNLIEDHRNKGHILEPEQLLQLLVDYRNFIFSIRITIYSEYLLIWNNLIDLKESINSNSNILKI